MTKSFGRQDPKGRTGGRRTPGGRTSWILFGLVFCLSRNLFWQVWLLITSSPIIAAATAIIVLLITAIAMADGITAMVIKVITNVVKRRYIRTDIPRLRR